MRKSRSGSLLNFASVALLLALAVTSLVAPAHIVAQSVWNPKSAAWNVFSTANDQGSVGLQEYTENVQYHLDRMGCYEDRVGNIDHRWGSESRKALEQFTAKAGNALPTAARKSASTYSASAFLTFLETQSDGYCAGGQGKPGLPRSGTCNRGGVGRNYLSSRAGEIEGVSRLTPTLEAFNAAFDRIFPPGQVDLTKGWDKGTTDRLNDVAGNRVTHGTAKKALQEAVHQLAALSFAYGVQNNAACNACYQINDWIYLRNIAQASSGQLIHTEETSDGKKAFARFGVAAITEKMMPDVSRFIRIHRGASSNLDLHLKYLEQGLPEGMDRRRVSDRLLELNKARDQALRDIILRLLDISRDKSKSEARADNRMMRVVETSYRCEGFDGSTVDQ